LLVLGGLAVLLLAAGSAGYLRRRMGNGDDGDGLPPADPPAPPVA
jgi:MprA protease rhombosortase-interaction domain-containing protein